MADLKNTTISDTGFLKLPTGTTSQRPQSPVAGSQRFNSQTNQVEFWNGVNWLGMSAFEPISATGGAINDIVIDGFVFREHRFEGNGNYDFTVNSLGTSNGLVAYEIIQDGASQQRSGTVDQSYLEGEILRSVDPFLDNNIIFEHTSKTAGPVSGWTNGQNGSPRDDTIYSQAEVNGSCTSTNTFLHALNEHYRDPNGRMPTIEEYITDGTKGSGCGYDTNICWSCTKGTDTSTHWVSRGDQDDASTGDTRTEPNRNTYEIRQVADADLNRPDPIILQDNLVFRAVVNGGNPYTVVAGPQVQANTTYNLLLGSGTSDAIPHTGKQSTDSVSGVDNLGTVVVRYPLRRIIFR